MLHSVPFHVELRGKLYLDCPIHLWWAGRNSALRAGSRKAEYGRVERAVQVTRWEQAVMIPPELGAMTCWTHEALRMSRITRIQLRMPESESQDLVDESFIQTQPMASVVPSRFLRFSSRLSSAQLSLWTKRFLRQFEDSMAAESRHVSRIF